MSAVRCARRPGVYLLARYIGVELLLALSLAVSLTVLLADSPTVAAAEVAIQFQDRTAADVLHDYEKLGLAFIYSSDVFDTGRRFTKEPGAGTEITRLRQALAQLDVALRIADHSRRWLIVPAPRSTPPPAAAAATTPPAHSAASPRLLETVVVVASRYALQNEFTSSNQFDALQLAALPELGDDALRRVNHIPGVASLGLSAQTHVRGGDVDETLILLDGIELLSPYHLRTFNSVFSGVNPGAVDHIDVYTGGFPARYGGRFGAVLDIGTRRDPPGLGGELHLSPFATTLVAHGDSAPDESEDDTPGKRQWLFAARRGNLSTVARRLNASIGSPDYHDALVQGSWQIDSRVLGAGALLYDDDVKLRETNSDGIGAKDSANDQSRYAWLRAGDAGDRWKTQTLLHFADLGRTRRGSVNDPDVDESIGRIEDSSHFQRLSFEQSLQWQRGENWDFDVGLSLRLDKAHYRYRGDAERGDLAIVLGVPTDFRRDVRLNLRRKSAALYGSLQWQLSDPLRAEMGARFESEDDAGDGADAVAFTPRLSLRYQLSPDTDVRFSFGRFRQTHGLYELQVADNETRPQQAQVADHLIVGIDHRFANGNFRVHAEAFGKWIAHPKRHYENLFDAPLLVPELSPDRVLVAATHGRARGFEVQLNYQPTAEFGASLNVTTATAEERVNGAWAARTWDQKHTVQGSVLWTPAQWTVSGGLTWHSGWRTTRLPHEVAAVEPLNYQRNSDNLSDFLSLDMRVSRLWAGTRQSFLLFGEVTNFTNHHNVGAVTYQFNQPDDVESVRIDREHERLLPIVPSIGFVWKFY